MKHIVFLQSIRELFFRWQYPISTPHELAIDLGLALPRETQPIHLIQHLIHPSQQASHLHKWMDRKEAESLFKHAIRKERFAHDSLFSYHFKCGWIEFALHFDEKSRLRRLYIRHKTLSYKHEISIIDHDSFSTKIP